MKNQAGKQLECSETEYSQAYLQLSLTSNNKCKCGSLELSHSVSSSLQVLWRFISLSLGLPVGKQDPLRLNSPCTSAESISHNRVVAQDQMQPTLQLCDPLEFCLAPSSTVLWADDVLGVPRMFSFPQLSLLFAVDLCTGRLFRQQI